jgi:hypothetical protein
MTRRDFGAFLGIMGIALMAKLELANGGVKTEESAGSTLHIKNRRLFNFAMGVSKLTDWERKHIHQCEVCQEMAYVLMRQSVAFRT